MQLLKSRHDTDLERCDMSPSEKAWNHALSGAGLQANRHQTVYTDKEKW